MYVLRMIIKTIRQGFSDFLCSTGVTQGDPLSVFMYANGTLTLIHSLHNPAQWTQIWYAGDASVCGHFTDRFRPDAERLFGTLGVWIVTGHCF